MIKTFSCAVTAASACFVVGCSSPGGLDGEIGGFDAPQFASAAFGMADPDSGVVHVGTAMAGDACVDGAGMIAHANDVFDARTVDGQRDEQDDFVDFINERVPLDSWLLSVVLVRHGGTERHEQEIDLTDQVANDTQVELVQVCRHERDAERDGSVVDDGSECFQAVEGELSLFIERDAVTVRSEDDLHFVGVTGQTGDDAEGDARIDITFGACDEFDDAVDDLVN